VRFGPRSAALCLADDALAVGSAGSSSVIGLDAAAGRERWRSEFERRPRDVSAHRGAVYTRCRDRMVARHAADGTERWRRAPDLRSAVDRPLQVGRSLFLAADAERVYLVTGPGDDEGGPLAQILYALDRADGSLVWASPVGGGAYHARRTAAGTRDRLLVGSRANGLAAYAVADGTRLWHARGYGPVTVAEPAAARFGSYGRLLVRDGLAFARTPNRELVAVDVATGDRAWSRPVNASVPAAAVVDGTLVVVEAHEGSATHRARGLDATDGSDRFAVPLGAVPAGRPVAADGTVYAPFLEYARGDAPTIELHAVDAVAGTRRWRSAVLDGTVDRPPLALDLADGAVVATVNDTDSRSFADTRVVAASTTDGAVRLRRSIEDHATVAARGDAVYVAEEFSGRVRRFDVR
jgi:outer membrane protein assembly factor BamB